MSRYVRWMRQGYMSSNGSCFDIGMTVSSALVRFGRTGDPFSGSTAPDSAGNGCLMRLAPVPMYFFRDRMQAVSMAGESSRTTHGAEECIQATRLFGAMIHSALSGESKETILLGQDLQGLESPSIASIAKGGYLEKQVDEIRGSGYVVESLEAALWCFHNSTSYRDAVLTATNLGHDADTTAAICGQLAGAYYGAGAIPGPWLKKLVQANMIGSLADQLFLVAGRVMKEALS
jgi:ADP-ribosyl-[dinitrogen reductase] hydrolase